MNDSVYGLTARVCTADEEEAVRIGDRIDTGTSFMNRCDYLFPALAGVGVSDLDMVTEAVTTSIAGNPVPLDESELRRLLETAIAGDLGFRS